ncbi:exosortase/archaeosortase family protein [Crateriforma conspicua]|uniref:Transmembrane exosortase n=1 Tax=Crateriforma conspicua TaxID=2527996 RepID=A0A5C5Y5W6_9PLAN|nr:exosortase/archaeosortase family protein [Crateriforma conspicua]TWT70514.1 Transmembrane exosortase [Crateriforma conspicua]
MSSLSSEMGPKHDAAMGLPDGSRDIAPMQVYAVVGVLGLVIGWTYHQDVSKLVERWWSNSDYVHGFLVIPFAVYLAWSRRSMIPAKAKGTFWGITLVLAAVGLRCFSAYMSDPILAPASLVICLFGVAMCWGGLRYCLWLWPSFIFLLFMIPLPNFMESWGNLVLQRVATVSSTGVLQTLGVPAASFGNVILLSNAELGVEEACSGLRSTVLFLAVSAGAAFLLKSAPERLAVLLAAIPAAVIANIVRIVATGLLYQFGSAELASAVFHDFFGFLMLPLAAGMVYGVVLLVQMLLVPTEDEGPLLMDTSIATG